MPSGWAITQATWKSSPFMPTKTGTTNKWVFGISPPVETGTLVYVTLPTNAFERTYQIAGSAKYLQGPSEIIRVTAGDTLLHSCDRDADGMPDDWERAFGLNPTNTADAGQHGDSDGLHNLAEYLADTNPTNPDSVLSVIAIQPESGGVRIEWRGGVQATQYAERRSDLSQTSETWTAFLTNLPPTLLTNYVIDAEATNETRFYRIKAERK
ncbi:MAG: hypothetical protein FJ224_07840 [Lentisphaerae bacterium]|nr:hypothetical protein [Lentisphaerota bacterium]